MEACPCVNQVSMFVCPQHAPPGQLLLSNGRRIARSVAERFHIKWATPHKCRVEMCTAFAFLPSGLLGSEENTGNTSILHRVAG